MKPLIPAAARRAVRWRPGAGRCPSGLRRDPVRHPHRLLPLETAGDVLRRHSPQRPPTLRAMERGRCPGTSTPGDARPAGRQSGDRPVARHRGPHPGNGQTEGGADRAKPGRPRQAGKQDPSADRPARAATDRGHLGGQHPRRPSARPTAGLPAPGTLTQRPQFAARPSCTQTRPTTSSTFWPTYATAASRDPESSPSNDSAATAGSIESSLSWLMRYRRLIPPLRTHQTTTSTPSPIAAGEIHLHRW